MVLRKIDDCGIIDYIPHNDEFETWKSRLTREQIGEIKDEINSLIGGDEVKTSSWMPGNDWENTPFNSIYENACQMNVTTSGLCFGLFVWEVMMEREEDWAFGRFEKAGIPIKGLTYFKITCS